MLKILEIKKQNEPWKPNDKPWTMYSVWADVEYNGTKGNGKVCAFTDKIKLETGATFENNVTMEKKSGQNGQYAQFTIKAEKKPFKGGYQAKEKYNRLEFEAVMNRAIEYAMKKHSELIEATPIMQSYIKYAMDHSLKIDKEEYMEPNHPEEPMPDFGDDADNGKDVPF